MSKPWCSPVLVVCIVAAPLASTSRAGEEKKGYLGVQIRKEDDSAKIMVVSLDDDGPAKKAGLEPGDTLLLIGDLKPTDLPMVVKFIQSLKPGRKIKVRVERGGQEKEIEVTIGAL